MRNKPIIILNGEPNSIFIEILFKSIKKKKYNSPIILISSHELIKFYMKKFKFNKKVNLIDVDNFDQKKLFQNSINLIDVKFKLSKNLNKISNKSNKFINKSFNLGFELLNKVNTNKFINGPISKKNFLNKKHPVKITFLFWQNMVTDYKNSKNLKDKFLSLFGTPEWKP